MDIIDFLNKNPALISIVAFPLGLLLLALTAKGMGLGSLVKVMGEHVAAEVKIEARLTDMVAEIKGLLVANQNNRDFYISKFDHFDDRLTEILSNLGAILTKMPKRKEDL